MIEAVIAAPMDVMCIELPTSLSHCICVLVLVHENHEKYKNESLPPNGFVSKCQTKRKKCF